RDHDIDAGLHLNLTTALSAPNLPAELVKHQNRLASYLRRPLAVAVFHPGLIRSFESVVAAQIREFHRLYGTGPDRLDGHHPVNPEEYRFLTGGEMFRLLGDLPIASRFAVPPSGRV